MEDENSSYPSSHRLDISDNEPFISGSHHANDDLDSHSIPALLSSFPHPPSSYPQPQFNHHAQSIPQQQYNPFPAQQQFHSAPEVDTPLPMHIATPESTLEADNNQNGICYWSFFACLGFVLLITTATKPVLGALLICACIPSIGILAYLYRRFKQLMSRELAITYYFLGQLSIIAVLIVEFILLVFALPFSPSPSLDATETASESPPFIPTFFKCLYQAFFVASLVEESSKVLVFLILRRKPQIISAPSVCLYTICGSLGFALIENGGYVLSTGFKSGIGVAFLIAALRGIVSVPLHAVCAGLSGERLARKFYSASATSLSLPTLDWSSWYHIIAPSFILHGLFDFCLLLTIAYPNLFMAILTFIIAPTIVIYGFLRLRKAFRESHVNWASTGMLPFNPWLRQNHIISLPNDYTFVPQLHV